jgi:hypothetical protein
MLTANQQFVSDVFNELVKVVPEEKTDKEISDRVTRKADSRRSSV